MIDNAKPIYHYLDFNRLSGSSEKWVVDRFGLRLQAKVGGPLDIRSSDGSLGRRLLPRGFAIDAQLRCYFISRTTGVIWRYDSSDTPHDPLHPFRPIIDFREAEVRTGNRQKSETWSLAAGSDHLVVIWPNCREVISFSLVHSGITHRQSFGHGQWPVDVVASANEMYLLTNRAVYIWDAQANCWTLLVARFPKQAKGLQRLLLDHEKKLWAWDPDAGYFQVAKTSDGYQWNKATLERSQLDVPPVYTLHTSAAQPRQFVIPADLTCSCDRRLPEYPVQWPPELRFAAVTASMQSSDSASNLTSGFVIEETGRRVTTQPAFLPRKQSLVAFSQTVSEDDYWISPRIDSQRYACVWDVVELQLLDLPPSGRVEVATYTSDDPQAVAPAYDSSLWNAGLSIKPDLGLKLDVHQPVDFPIHSGDGGQYLWLRVRISGDGFATPVISRILCRAPRQSYTDYLPAVMLEDDASRDFLDRFLAVFQVGWESLDDTIQHIDHLFDAQRSAASQLDHLARSLGLPLPGEWTERQRRDFLQAAKDLLIAKENEQFRLPAGTARGTAAHLKHYLQAVLSAITGRSVEDLQGFPWIIEGFRQRTMRPLAGYDGSLNHGCTMQPGPSPAAWPALPADESRQQLRLGRSSRLGQQQLLSPTAKQLEPYASHAYRFQVLIPSSWVADEKALKSIQRIVESEKPAHTMGALALVQPGVCIGLQSTLGIDTILADRPEPILGHNPPTYLGLGQGLSLPSSGNQPGPLQLDDYLGTHRL